MLFLVTERYPDRTTFQTLKQVKL